MRDGVVNPIQIRTTAPIIHHELCFKLAAHGSAQDDADAEEAAWSINYHENADRILQNSGAKIIKIMATKVIPTKC